MSNQSVTFPTVLSKSFNDDFSSVYMKVEDQKYRPNLTIESMCKGMVEAGLIEDYYLEEESVEIEVPVYTHNSDEQMTKPEYRCVYDFITDLSLEDCSRILKSHIDNDNCQEDDLPF
jgi:hypothetical protein